MIEPSGHGAAGSGFAVRPLAGAKPRARAEQTVVGDRWRISVLSEGLFRIEWSDDGGFEDRASTLAIRRETDAAPFELVRDGVGGLELRTSRATLRYDGEPFSARGLSVERHGRGSGRWRYGDARSDLGGTARTLDDVDGRTPLDAGVVSREGIAVLDDSDSFVFDDDGWIGARMPGRRDLYVFAFGLDHAQAVRALYDLSGAPPVLPRWALGNWWSRFHPYSDDEYLALVDRFRAENLPLAVAVLDMDWHRVGDVPAHLGTGWTGYSWNRSLFPDPERFLRELHDRGLKATLNLHPADGVRAHEEAYAAVARRMGVEPSTERAIAFDPTDPTFLSAYFDELHHPLEEQGVDFWWLDWQQGQKSALRGVDPLWLLNHFHHLDATRDGRAGLTFSRYAGPGSHRYAVGFSGDTVISWASLAFQPEFTATAANIGYGWWSHDIGGHLDGSHDDELATRWVQFGAFSPIMRLHSTRNPFLSKEPWSFPVAHEKAMGEALRFRHRLLPYLHTMNHRAAAGIPLVRPMYHENPTRDEAYEVPNQYLFGSELLVAPIVRPSEPVTRTGAATGWLPPGGWTDIFTGTRYSGDRRVEFHRDIDSIPVLLRDGGIVPLSSPDEPSATENPEAIELLIAPAAPGAFTLVEDTGGSSVCTTPIRWDPDSLELRIGPATEPVGVVPEERLWTVTFLGRGAPDTEFSVSTGGAVVTMTPTIAGHRWSVSFRARADVGAVVRLQHPPLTDVDPLPLLQRLVRRAHSDNAQKVRAWRVITGDRPAAERLAELYALGLPETLLAAITEVVGA